MTLEDDDSRRAVEEMAAMLEETREVPISVPLGTAYDVGNAIVLAVSAKRDTGGVHLEEAEVLLRLEAVIPWELIQKGREGFTGNLEQPVGIVLNYKRITTIGNSALALPSGKYIAQFFPIDSSGAVEIDGFRNRGILGALAFQDSFVRAGGKANRELKEQLEQSLS